MNKVQFFYDDDLVAMERKINDWLALNKNIKIIDTNITSLGKPSQRAGITYTEKYVFYILYSAPNTDSKKKLKEDAMESDMLIERMEANIQTIMPTEYQQYSKDVLIPNDEQ
jgi:hypothetical protein